MQQQELDVTLRTACTTSSLKASSNQGSYKDSTTLEVHPEEVLTKVLWCFSFLILLEIATITG